MPFCGFKKKWSVLADTELEGLCRWMLAQDEQTQLSFGPLQHFESVHPNNYSIHELWEHMKEQIL